MVSCRVVYPKDKHKTNTTSKLCTSCSMYFPYRVLKMQTQTLNFCVVFVSYEKLSSLPMVPMGTL